MMDRRQKTLRVVPLGDIDPETVAEFAHGLKRLTGVRVVEIALPRRLDGVSRLALLEGAARHLPANGNADELTLGIAQGDAETVEIDASRGVSVVVMPSHAPAGLLFRAARVAIAALSPAKPSGPARAA